MKLFYLLFISLLFSCIPNSIGLQGPPGPQGEKGEAGLQGKKGQRGQVGPKGISGKSISQELLNKIENLLVTNDEEIEFLVDVSSYSFGFAPKVTGFCFLTNYGRLYKLENKNIKTLGGSIELITKIDNHRDFIAVSRNSPEENITQYFTAATRSGTIYTSNDLINWKEKTIIKFIK